jgi:hypothetical protein
MRITRHFSRATFSTALALCLVACGGGGTGAAGAGSAGGDANTPADTISAYVGTYTSTCFKNPDVTSAATGDELFEIDTFTVGTVQSASKAAATLVSTFHSTEACTDTPLDTLTISGPNTFLNIDGSKTVSGQQVEKVDISQDAPFLGISAGTLIINGLKFSGTQYSRQTASTSKEIWRLDATNDVFVGDETKPLDSNGYPTLLQTEATLKKS